jgi:hypothetical protein
LSICHSQIWLQWIFQKMKRGTCYSGGMLQMCSWFVERWTVGHFLIVWFILFVVNIWTACWFFGVCYSLWISKPKRYQVCLVYQEWQKSNA